MQEGALHARGMPCKRGPVMQEGALHARGGPTCKRHVLQEGALHARGGPTCRDGKGERPPAEFSVCPSMLAGPSLPYSPTIVHPCHLHLHLNCSGWGVKAIELNIVPASANLQFTQPHGQETSEMSCKGRNNSALGVSIGVGVGGGLLLVAAMTALALAWGRYKR